MTKGSPAKFTRVIDTRVTQCTLVVSGCLRLKFLLILPIFDSLIHFLTLDNFI